MISRFPVTIHLKAPFATRSNAVGAFGLDLPLARNAKGQLIIAGTHIVGKLAEATRELTELAGNDLAKDYCADLVSLHADGSQTPDKDNETDGREPRRNLSASDFVLEGKAGEDRPRTRIARDNVTGIVAEGMMQVIEQPFAAGEEVRFKGELRVVGPQDDKLQARLTKVLNFMTQVGGLRTIGFGAVSKVTVGAPVPMAAAAKLASGSRRLILRLRFKDPFCAGEARNSPNGYVSAGYVPGGVIKGAIARQILAAAGVRGYLDTTTKGKLPEDLRSLVDHFQDIVIRHALPVPPEGTKRPKPAPDSLAAVEVNQVISVVDLAGLDDPSKAVLIEEQVPIGRFDWKDKHHDLCDKIFGEAERPGSELRVRTQIDRTWRSAKVNRLFAVEYTSVHQHDFLSEVELPADLAQPLAKALQGGLGGIGRGGAFAEVELLEKVGEWGNRPDPKETKVVLTLNSMALLRRPDSHPDLADAYQTAFREIGLPSNWSLQAVFARERLGGGNFFLRRLGGESNYHPWLLTERGATFVFLRNSNGPDLPAAWFNRGLPVPPSVLAFHGLDQRADLYRYCPFLPENGYGEISPAAETLEGRTSHLALAPKSIMKIATVEEVLV